MSAITLSHVSPTIAALYAQWERLFAGVNPHGRLFRDLKDLPDHLLLDIGVDPRDVPGGEAGVRSEVLWREAVAMSFRTAAKSS